ncbi:related to signal recognition particle protein Sec65 [Ramularia collo-cygni]|uniref:Related to signal recognition particle protein Sec65 n=1 Tax=Ramularia collo-cygni TaxID=112498 RepID=A0A2D3VDQ4_9PEZI|nr:related to signal recognition particle protein Sec65 [Ramularia collo-cygni]CZT23915.1 related to signal recognition particle protein Sec65 [Ramularia collo-cygni]
MSNPRIEEVEDDDIVDDPEEMDLDEFDFAKPQKGSLQTTADAEDDDEDEDDVVQQMLSGQMQRGGTGTTQVPQMPRMDNKERERYQREQMEKSKNYQSLYPVYFDSTRSREEGRRVRKEDAIPNPLAREIVDALSHIGATVGVALQIVFEPTKTHPKDWANPGRVKVLIKRDGKPISAKIQNKHHLYKMISAYMKKHPTTEDAPQRLQLAGMPPQKERIPPAIPRGFKIGTILPLHSPALSGGGVSDNMFKDMMAEMGGQLPAGMAGMGGDAGGQPPKKVKDKKKK